MRRRDWLDRISDILDAAQRVREYTDGFDLDAFARDRKTVDAVVCRTHTSTSTSESFGKRPGRISRS